MPGIVVGGLMGAAGVAWALGRPVGHGRSQGAEDAARLIHLAWMVGYGALLAGALLSLARHPVGNRLVRITAWTMIPVLAALYALTASEVARARAGMGGAGADAGPLFLLMGGAWFFAIVPWLLCLYLFRRSRYP